MAELSNLGTGMPAPNPQKEALAQKSDEELLAMLQETPVGEPDSVIQPEPEPIKTEPVEQVVPTVTAVHEKQPESVNEVVEPKVTEREKVEPTLEEVIAKRNFKSPDDLAKSYEELVKAFHTKRQQESRATNPQPVPVQNIPTVQAPETVNTDINQMFLDDLQRDPLNTLAKVNMLMNQPVRDELARYQRKSVISELSGNPNTADFADPTIQTAMMDEYKNHPEWCQTNDEVNKHIIDAYHIARSKTQDMAIKKAFIDAQKSAEESIRNRRTATVEGSSRPVQSTSVTLNTATEDQLRDALLSQLSKQGL